MKTVKGRFLVALSFAVALVLLAACGSAEETTPTQAGITKAELQEALAAAARRILRPDDGVVVIAPGDTAKGGLAASWVEGRTELDGVPTAYVCRGQVCSAPVTDPRELTTLEGEVG